MARQKLNHKKVKKLRLSTGLDILHVLVRGGTDHRKDLLLNDGTVKYLYKNGTIEDSGINWVNNH